MTEELTRLAQDSSDEQLLHRLEVAPEDWSPDALEAARVVLRERGVSWKEKAIEAPPRVPLASQVMYLVLGLVAAVAAFVPVFVFGVNPRWLILLLALTGGLGYAVPRRP
ncbi:MAG: hypothetical protein AB7S26_16500 [Sandaracinaceae bacterium]